jgi:hypothetical protein
MERRRLAAGFARERGGVDAARPAGGTPAFRQGVR